MLYLILNYWNYQPRITIPHTQFESYKTEIMLFVQLFLFKLKALLFGTVYDIGK